LSKKTDSNNPSDWLWISESDLSGIRKLAECEISYEMCRGKLAEVIEKIMKAELIRQGWFLVKTHDLQKLAGEVGARDTDLLEDLKPLVTRYSEVYFMTRYPSFDLEEPDWVGLRDDVVAVSDLLNKVRAKVNS
jgi:HEPN domain-containing protein